MIRPTVSADACKNRSTGRPRAEKLVAVNARTNGGARWSAGPVGRNPVYGSAEPIRLTPSGRDAGANRRPDALGRDGRTGPAFRRGRIATPVRLAFQGMMPVAGAPACSGGNTAPREACASRGAVAVFRPLLRSVFTAEPCRLPRYWNCGVVCHAFDRRLALKRVHH